MREADLVRLIHEAVNGHKMTGAAAAGREDWQDEQLCGCLSALANAKGGGLLLFGLELKEKAKVTGISDRQALTDRLQRLAGQMEPEVVLQMTEAEVDGKEVLAAEVCECGIWEKPCYDRALGRKKGAYLCTGTGIRPMTEYEYYQQVAFRDNIHEDKRIVGAADMSCLDSALVDAYIANVKEENESLREFDKDRILKTQGMAEDGRPTLAGLLLFGEYPQEFFPSLNILCEKRDRTCRDQEGGQFGQKKIKIVEGSIGQMVSKAEAFVAANARLGSLEENEEFQYDVGIVRELVLNALLHRDYSRYTEQTPITLTVFDDRLVIENPGGLYGRCSLEQLGQALPDTRNVYLVKAAGYIFKSRPRFGGIQKVNALCGENMKPPLFKDDGNRFQAVIFKNYSTDGSRQRMEEKILDYCSIPRTREELAAYFGIETTSYIIKKYVNPLIKEGKINMEIPEKPKSKFQKYYRNQSEQ